jgi:GDP-4-dehydro-6-deoxy-D-mannose reductase
MRVLVTGAHGFVGGWLTRSLAAEGDEVVALDPGVDLRDRARVEDALRGVSADACVHLAALSHVGESWRDPERYYANNVLGTANLVTALVGLAPRPRLLMVSSSEVYGPAREGEEPLSEDRPVRPVSPYAASKAAAELVALQRQWAGQLEVVVARPFNHTGPGQAPHFVVPGLLARMLEAKATGATSIKVGNLSVERDFLDVRDVVRAYRMLLRSGVPGEAYNICRGHTTALRELVALMEEVVGVEVSLEIDPALLRVGDPQAIPGSNAKLVAATGFVPRFELRTTIEDMAAAAEGRA